MIEFTENRALELSFFSLWKRRIVSHKISKQDQDVFKKKKNQKYKENSIIHTGLQPSVRRTVALSKATAFINKQRLFLTLEPDDVYPNKAYILNEA